MSQPVGAVPIRPLTERVLARLGRPRLFWMLAWGFLSLAVYEVSFHFFDDPTYPGRAAAVGAAYVNLMALWAIARITADLEATRPLVQRLTEGTSGSGSWPFRAVESLAGPLIVGLMLAVLWNVADFVRHPGALTAFLIPVMFAAWLPAQTALWFFGALLVGLDRLGRMPLHLIAFEETEAWASAPWARSRSPASRC